MTSTDETKREPVQLKVKQKNQLALAGARPYNRPTVKTTGEKMESRGGRETQLS
jgi:hypothetical protein